MSHRFSFLLPGNPLHGSLLRHLAGPEPVKCAAARAELPESAVPVEERILLRAFSNELEKMAFLGPLLAAAGEGLPYALAGELGYEGVNRLMYPDAPRRSPLELAKDVGTSLLFHAPLSAGLKGMGSLAKSAPLGSWTHWLANNGQGPLSFVEGLFNPKTQMAWRAGQPVIEKAFGVEKGAPKTPAVPQPGGPTGAPGQQEDPLRPSYSTLRQMDPRAVSARYLS